MLLLLCGSSVARRLGHPYKIRRSHRFLHASSSVVVCPSSVTAGGDWGGSSVRRPADPSSPSAVGPGWPGAPHAEGTPQPPKWLEIEGHAPSSQSRQPVAREQHRRAATAGRHAPQMNARASSRDRPSLEGLAHPPALTLTRCATAAAAGGYCPSTSGRRRLF
eukprot:CAMPEP_0182531948 /NCGR_PEP_ID=MMETSP1323-20130603/10263_1 /TAXON_ID=236787 /ORGANISM="Florenciella parvula, Strain RCC1693" /LENGTH=162 /DNA_ID=CAMNT_0024741595 /DNA_START=226 /DNA_END=714 /DNA_ORIENTATION=+